MTEHRRLELSEEELEIIANKLSEKINSSQRCVVFTPAEHAEIKNIIAAKRGALWVVGVIILWLLKDAYFWIISHLSWGK